MRILVGWDDPFEAETLTLFLNVGDHQAALINDPERLLCLAESERWDVILFSMDLPDREGAFSLFRRLRETDPSVPIVGACFTAEMINIPKFLRYGMRSYVIRDDNSNFIFLLLTLLEDTVEAVRAEREQQIASRLREEIESVRKLQASIIPEIMSSPEGYLIEGRYEPAQIHVVGGRPVMLAGGDYYDALQLDEETSVVLVGDASGHGMRACMSIVVMHTLVRMIQEEQHRTWRSRKASEHSFAHDPAAFVASMNRLLCDQSIIQEEGGFITMVYGVLDTSRHEFTWASAGHSPPLLQELRQGFIEPVGNEDTGGLPLGVLADAEYQSYSVQIPSQSRLLLYTDGLIEAFADNGHGHTEFGVQGVRQTLSRVADHPLPHALQALFDDSHSFTQGQGRHDDTSILLIERNRE